MKEDHGVNLAGADGSPIEALSLILNGELTNPKVPQAHHLLPRGPTTSPHRPLHPTMKDLTHPPPLMTMPARGHQIPATPTHTATRTLTTPADLTVTVPSSAVAALGAAAAGVDAIGAHHPSVASPLRPPRWPSRGDPSSGACGEWIPPTWATS